MPANGKLAHHPPHTSRAGLLSAETTVLVTPVAPDEWHGPAIAFAKWGSRRPFSRREEMLIERGWGLGPFISVLDVSGTYAPHPVLVDKHEYVDSHIPPERFPDVNAAAHAELEAKFEQHKGS